MSVAENILRRWSELETAMSPWLAWWQQLADHVCPRKAEITERSGDSPNRDKVAKLFDTTAMDANQVLAAGQMANITPMGQQWFNIEPPERLAKNYAVRLWFQDASQRLGRALIRSNFYSAMDELYLDRGGFGTAAVICRMTPDKRLVFETLTIGGYGIGENDERMVDTLHRRYRLTPRQLAQRFRELPADLKARAADPQKANIPADILHAIEPREDRDPSRGDEARHMPVRSVFIHLESKEVIHEAGFFESPFACTRWRLWGESPWGWSPAWYALPTADQLNFLEQCTDVQVERAAFPAWLIPSTMKGEFDPRPHGQSIYDPRGSAADVALPRELESRGRVDYAMERAEQKRKMIRDAFFYDMFRLLSSRDKQLTAREVVELSSEKASQFHPFFARLTTELLQPLLKRAFAEALRGGLFEKPPLALFEKGPSGWVMDDPEIAFTSRLAQALDMQETNGLLRTFETLAPMAQLDPGVFDFIDSSKVGPAIARSLGVSASIMLAEEDIEAKKQARAQAAQAAAAMESAQMASQAVRNVGGVEKAREIMGGMP